MNSCRVTTSGIGPLLVVVVVVVVVASLTDDTDGVVASLTDDADGVAVLTPLLVLVGVLLFCLNVT